MKRSTTKKNATKTEKSRTSELNSFQDFLGLYGSSYDHFVSGCWYQSVSVVFFYKSSEATTETTVFHPHLHCYVMNRTLHDRRLRIRNSSSLEASLRSQGPLSALGTKRTKRLTRSLMTGVINTQTQISYPRAGTYHALHISALQ